MTVWQVLEAYRKGCTWSDEYVKAQYMKSGGYKGYASDCYDSYVRICFNSDFGGEAPVMYADNPMLVPFYGCEVSRIEPGTAMVEVFDSDDAVKQKEVAVLEIWIASGWYFPTVIGTNAMFT